MVAVDTRVQRYCSLSWAIRFPKTLEHQAEVMAVRDDESDSETWLRTEWFRVGNLENLADATVSQSFSRSSIGD